jgi:hypothetical protein
MLTAPIVQATSLLAESLRMTTQATAAAAEAPQMATEAAATSDNSFVIPSIPARCSRSGVRDTDAGQASNFQNRDSAHTGN